MNIALLAALTIPLSILSFLVIISPELRRRRNNNINDANNNNISNAVDTADQSLHNIGKIVGNVISFGVIFSVLLLSIRSMHSFSSLSLSQSSCTAPNGINLIGVYGNIKGLEGIRNITARKSETQILFKQGMIHLYGFNFEEANRNMKAAISIENDCIMCYWGLAYSYGPNINLGVYEDAAKNGRIAIQKAISLIKRNSALVTLKEIDLVYAQYERFQGSLKEWNKNGQQYYDEKYANAMKLLTVKYPVDYDIAAESVDATMLLRPWNYYSNNYTELHPDIVPAYEILKNVLLHVPDHTLASHLWIHITEQGPNPTLALKQADMLLRAGEGIGHLVHMPSHIYFRTGLYSLCINSSLMSIITDDYYMSKCLSPYVTNHNKALLVLCATYSGRYNLALEYASESALFMEEDASKYVSALFPSPKELIFARFGKWSNIIELQEDEEKVVEKTFIASRPAYIKSLRQYSKLLALIHTSNSTDLIINALQGFSKVINEIPEGSPPLIRGHVFYPYHRELGVLMNAIVQAAWLLKQSHSPKYLSTAIHYLEDAVNLQDSFLYMEPEHHYFPIRHCLASALIALSDTSINDSHFNRINLLLQARKVYNDDLLQHPKNGWVYSGMMKLDEKLKRLGYNETIVVNTKELYYQAWAWADMDILGSCCELNFC